MIDSVAKIFLTFSHEVIIIPLLILGFIYSNRDIFYHAICLILLSMLYSFALKLSFQIYSPIYGLIFPSGHMLAASVLYGWLAYKFNLLFLRILILALLTIIGVSLVYFRYHDYYDVFGGVFFAIILLASYNFILLKIPQLLLKINLAFASLLMLYIYIRNGEGTPAIWLAYYALVGFIFSNKALQQKIDLKSITAKIFATIFCFLSIFIIKNIFSFIVLPIYLFQLQWLLIGAIIPISCFSAHIILAKKSTS